MGASLAGGLVGAEKIEEGTLQMKEAAAKYEQLQERLHQAEEAQARELKEAKEAQEAQEEQEREDDRLLEEAEDMLQESYADSTPANGGAPPANAESYSGELPSFPAQIINAPPPHEPEISIQPLDNGGGYNNTPGRIY